MILISILEWLFVIILLITFILLSMWVIFGFNKKTRFTPIPGYAIKEIGEILNIKNKSIVYNLSCGDGRPLFYLSGLNSEAEYIGVSDNYFLLKIAKLHNWWNKINNKKVIKIINKDFFDQDLSNATDIILYLYPNIMDDLLPKLDKELKKGTRVISLNFHFTVKKSIKEIEIKSKSYQHRRVIYVYEF